MSAYEAVEICAGAGGQALGLERASFAHALAVEIDETAASTLRTNRPDWTVAVGDVADPGVWSPADYEGVDLLAGGVPCPPFSMAGKQLGTADERDLFAWAVEQACLIRPRALMLENVRGMTQPRFAPYRQAVVERLSSAGYSVQWKLLHASDYGVPQLRPRFVLVALRPEDAAHFEWPEPAVERITVGAAIGDLMAENGWVHAADWAAQADGVAPTLVGGSKRHGGPDLGPTRARLAWSKLGVDGRGLANASPSADDPHFSEKMPRLTVPMTARLQGWRPEDNWEFMGGKTAQYRQIGNAFPPPLAAAVGRSIVAAFEQGLSDSNVTRLQDSRLDDVHDPIFVALRSASGPLTVNGIIREAWDVTNTRLTTAEVDKWLVNAARDFELIEGVNAEGVTYSLGAFRAFVGQSSHHRHEAFSHRAGRAAIS